MLKDYGLSAIVLAFIIDTYPAVVRLLGEDFGLTSGGEVGLRDLEDLGVVQFAVIMAMTECLEPVTC